MPSESPVSSEVASVRDRRIRVLALIKGLGQGGAESLLVSHATLRDRAMFDHEVVYLLAWRDDLVGALERQGVNTHCLDVDRDVDLRWAIRLRRLLNERHFDVVHVHSPYAAAIGRLIVRTLPRASRPVMVSTDHNLWGSFRPLSRWANAAMFPLGDAWLAVSQPVKDSMPRRLSRRVEVLVNGVQLDQFRPDVETRRSVRRELGVDDDEILAITVANLRRQKGYPDLLTAAAMALEREPRLRFVAVGQGPLQRELESQRSALKLGERFRFLGYREDVPRLLQGADLAVMASVYEGLPLAIMEALAAGLPIVATSVGGVPDAVTDGEEGFLVRSRDVDGLSSAVVKLAADGALRARMADAARVRSEAFDVAHSVRRTEALYLELLSRPATKARRARVRPQPRR